jgi:hypothetical protein
MANLTPDDHKAVGAKYRADLSRVRSALGALTKQEIDAAVAAVDAWVAANVAAFNQAVPEPARSALTAVQKSGLFSEVVLKRFEKEPKGP